MKIVTKYEYETLSREQTRRNFTRIMIVAAVVIGGTFINMCGYF